MRVRIDVREIGERWGGKSGGEVERGMWKGREKEEEEEETDRKRKRNRKGGGKR